MLEQAFDAAFRLITTGPGDQPLTRILRIAMEAAGCPMGFIAARQPQGHLVIVSNGIPLTQFREVLPLVPGVGEMFSRPGIIEDAAMNADAAGSALVKAGWRFFVSVPLPFNILPFPVVLTCADSRTGIARPPHMIDRMEQCAAIAADDMRMIGDIALQSEALSANPAEVALLAEAVSRAQLPILLVDEKLCVLAISRRLAERDDRPIDEQVGNMMSAAYFGVDPSIGDRIRRVVQTGEPLIAHHVTAYDGHSVSLVDAFQCKSQDGSQRFATITVTDRSQTLLRVEDVAAPRHESPGVVSEFLLTTLIRQKRLLRRGVVPYHALARWRTPIKDTQIAALKALKRDPGDAFLALIAEEMAQAARTLFGQQTFKGVTHVPCGNSGSNCLAARLASQVAANLGVEAIDAFEPLAPSGGSHPRGNTRRASMVLRQKPDVPVLLIDDVATSGAHIEEAAMLLRATAPAVLPLVWIAD
jgi:hypothetical protein